MEDFLYISLDKDQKDMELGISKIVQDNPKNLENLFLMTAEVGLLYPNHMLKEFEARGLGFLIEEEHVNLETSLREASNHFLRSLIVYLYTTDQTNTADQFVNCMLRMLRKAIDVNTKDMDKNTAIRTAEACLYFFEKALSEVKTQYDFTNVLAELNLSENYPEIVVYRIFGFLEELVSSVPFISDPVHQVIHTYVARYLESHGQPVVKLAAMQALVTIVGSSKATVLQKVNMSVFFTQFEAMMRDHFDKTNENYLLLFGNLLFKLVKALESHLSAYLDRVFSAIVFMSDSFCQGSRFLD